MDLSTQNFEFSTQGVLVTLRLRENLMKAFIEFIKDENSEFVISQFNREEFKTEVCAWIESKISEKLIDVKILQNAFEILFKNGTSAERKIAQGQNPKPGIDGKFLLMIKPLSESFEGIYDFNNRFQKKYDSIMHGAVIARLYEPKPGTDGFDVLNNTIQFTPGKEVELVLSENLRLKSQQNHPFKEIIADENGYVRVISENKFKNSYSISLETVLKIRGNIDHKVGSIIFENEIEINGDVKEGFKVDALKDIKISGNVNHSNIISREGSIKIDGIVLDEDVTDKGLASYLEKGSDNQHTISAHLKLVAEALQNARVFAGDIVEIKGSIVRSHVHSSSLVLCSGSVYASKISTACGIEANYFGNSSGVTTIVEFLNPVEAGIEYVRMKSVLDSLVEKKTRLELFLGPFIENQSSIRGLSTSHQTKIKESLIAIRNLLTNIKIETKNLNELKVNSKKVKYSQLNAVKGSYQNLIVKAEESVYKIEEDKLESFSLLYDWEEKTFSMKNFSNISCELLVKN